MAGIEGVTIIGAVQLMGRQNPNGGSGTERELFMQTVSVCHCAFQQLQGGRIAPLSQGRN